MRRKWILRSGHATGADQAFERGAGNRAEVYLPWPTFERGEPIHARLTMSSPIGEALSLSAEYHPGWDNLSNGARQLHGRNAHQILGPYLDRPAAFVVCWTPDGSGEGGTGQAIRIARAHGVRVYDLGRAEVRERIEGWLTD